MTSNPTPTPLASTAMEAARDLFPNWADNELATVSALIAHHFQPLLAKVEGERDALHRLIASQKDDQELAEIGQELIQLVEANTLERDESFEAADVLASHYKELIQLRADLAAKEAEAQRVHRQLIEACNRTDMGYNSDSTLALPHAIAETLQFLSALASRADKGGAR